MVEEMIHGWTGADSSWVSEYGYGIITGHDEPGLLIAFKDGFIAFYPNTVEEDYFRMDSADSKGQYLWASRFFSDYVGVRT